jgi:2-polyprenyl-3-methyl-5-hydroxy-6-metoxy-1,4-benzoquinol methylase
MRWLRRLEFELHYLLGRAPWDSGISPPELIAFLDAHPPGRALDIGCGTGTNALTMAGRGWQVTAIDFSSRALRVARRKALGAGAAIRFEHGDVSRLGRIEGPFDLALDIGCYHGLTPPQQETYARDLARLLRPGAAFLLYGFTDPEADPTSTLLSAAALDSRLGEGFATMSFVEGADRGRASAWATLRRKA